MADIETEQKKLISDFNEAKLQILRLHGLWSDCHRLSYSGELKKLNWKLDRVAVELSHDMWDGDGKMKSEQEESFYQRLKSINSKIKTDWDKKNDLYHLLLEKEMILRELQNAAGKGGRKRREDADLMD